MEKYTYDDLPSTYYIYPNEGVGTPPPRLPNYIQGWVPGLQSSARWVQQHLSALKSKCQAKTPLLA